VTLRIRTTDTAGLRRILVRAMSWSMLCLLGAGLTVLFVCAVTGVFRR
jgi:hypothetical protein